MKPLRPLRQKKASKRPQPQLPRTRGTFHRRPEPLFPKKTQGFVPKLSPRTKPKTKLMQHACSHYNAFSNITSPTRSSQRTWQHNMVTFMQPCHCDHNCAHTQKAAKAAGNHSNSAETNAHQNDRSAQHPESSATHIAPFIQCTAHRTSTLHQVQRPSHTTLHSICP